VHKQHDLQQQHIYKAEIQLASWSQSLQVRFDSLSQIPYQETSVIFCTDWVLNESKTVDPAIMLFI